MRNLKIAEKHGEKRRSAEKHATMNLLAMVGFSSILLIFNNKPRIDLIVMRNLKSAENRGGARRNAQQ
jgi:hypothetical protein